MKIGIDLGGTKIEGIVLACDGRELSRQRMETPVGDYKATVSAIRDLVANLTRRHNIPSDGPVGVGIPGTISPATGLVKNANSTCLIGQPFDADLTKALNRPVKLANDADCFAVSEAQDGAGKEMNSVFGVILGTGVGGGIVFHGKPLSGPNAIAGEWGHNPLPWPAPWNENNNDNLGEERPGRPCYCGKSGCIETYLSGPGLEADYLDTTGISLSAEDIAANDRDGQPSAALVLGRYENRLARALAGVINILDPDVIVLGGGLSNIVRLYSNVPDLWQEWVFSDRCDTRLLRNVHGDSSGVRGAAWLWS